MYYPIKIISKFFCLMPRKQALRIGRFLGYLTFLFSSKKKARAIKNLKLVFPEKDFLQILRIVRKNFESFGMSMVEALRIPGECGDINSDMFHIDGEEYFSSINNDSGIFIGIHMGSWEFINVVLAKRLKYAIIVRRQKNRAFDFFLNQQRQRHGLNIIYEDDLKGLIQCIKKGYILGLVFDHGTRDSGFYSELFKKLIPVPTGALRLALNFNKNIYPACLARQGDFCHKIKLFPPVEIKSREDFLKVSRHLNSCFEGFLRENPEDYLWWYKRFKRSKNLNILVLSDGKAGHLKQSLSLANLIKKKKPGSFIETVQVKISGLKRVLLDACNVIPSNNPMVNLSRLIAILGHDFDSVYKYADIIISCGCSVSSLNRLLSACQEAKSFIIQRPNIGLKRFDLAIIPFHDKSPVLNNTVRIKGSFVFYKEEELIQCREKLRGLSNDFNNSLPKIGIFLGGPIGKNYNKDYVSRFLNNLRESSIRDSWQLFITTSRRTPQPLEDFLQNNFKDVPLLVIANKKNFPFVSLGIVSLCDVILVSSDSVSMITEAATFKPTFVFDVFSAKQSKKHSRFISNLVKEGNIAEVNIANLQEKVNKILSQNIFLRRIDNQKLVEEVLKKRL